MNKSIVLIYLIALLAVPNLVLGQHSEHHADTLTKTIKQMDSLLFEVGFNQCDFELWQSIMNHELEFYDDRNGLNTSFEVEVRAFHDRCSKDFEVTRQLTYMEVYPLNNYGAVQLGEHQFLVDGKVVEKAKFVHIWEQKGKKWIVSRVVSYNHHPIP